MDDTFMKDLGEKLEPGAVAVVSLIRNANIEKLLENVKVPGTIIHSSLDDATEAALADALAAAAA